VEKLKRNVDAMHPATSNSRRQSSPCCGRPLCTIATILVKSHCCVAASAPGRRPAEATPPPR
jgi:hypothetical protein